MVKTLVVQINEKLVTLEFKRFSRKTIEDQIVYEGRRLDRLKGKLASYKKKCEELEYDIVAVQLKLLALNSETARQEIDDYEERKLKEKCEKELLEGRFPSETKR